MWGQLGNIIFDGSFSPYSYQWSENAIWVEHELVNRKNLLQPTGMSLKNISLEMLVRQDWVDVKTVLNVLNSNKRTFTVMPLLWGYGSLEGNFVISDMDVTHNQQLPDGTLIAASISLKLLEYVTDDEIGKQQQDLIKSAQAVGKPSTSLQDQMPPQKPGESQQTSQTVSDINSSALELDEAIAKYANTGIQNHTIIKDINNILSQANNVVNRINDPLSLFYQNTTLLYAVLNMQSTATAISNLVNSNILGGNYISEVILANGIFQQSRINFIALIFPGILDAILRNL